MSNRPHVRRGRRTHHRSADDPIAVLVAWCASEDELPAARKQSHDALIRMLGDRRRGGVTWVQYQGDEATKRIDDLQSDSSSSQELIDHYRHIKAFLREYGGWVVVAMAPGVLP